MPVLADFLKTTKTDCKRLHDHWSDAKEKSDKAWSTWKKENKGEALKKAETEYKKLKFDKDLGPDLDKLHKKDDEQSFLALTTKILNTVEAYQKMLKQAALPAEVEEPLEKSLKKLKTEVGTMEGDAPGIFKLEAEEQDEAAVNKGRLVPAFALVDIDFTGAFTGHPGWGHFGGQAPDLRLSLRITDETVRRHMAKYDIKIAALQAPFEQRARRLFEAYESTVTSLLNELHSSHHDQMPPDLARSEINDLMKEYRKEHGAKLGERLLEEMRKLAGESMDELISTRILPS